MESTQPEPEPSAIPEVLSWRSVKNLGLGENIPLGFEKVLINFFETQGSEKGKGHLEGSSFERGTKPSSEP